MILTAVRATPATRGENASVFARLDRIERKRLQTKARRREAIHRKQ